MSNDNTSKTCNICNEVKPVSEFYVQHNGKPSPVCKPCHHARNKAYTKKRKIDASQEHEQVCMEYMQGLGIYTVPGKLSEYAYVDLVSWGFIRVEVKFGERHTARQTETSWMFRFSDAQVKRRLLADVVVFIIPRDTWEYYVFDAKHPAFYRAGRLKNAVQFLENPSTRKFRIDSIPMTPEMMNAARDDWTILLDKMPDLRAIRNRVVETVIGNVKPIQAPVTEDKPMQKVLI